MDGLVDLFESGSVRVGGVLGDLDIVRTALVLGGDRLYLRDGTVIVDDRLLRDDRGVIGGFRAWWLRSWRFGLGFL